MVWRRITVSGEHLGQEQFDDLVIERWRDSALRRPAMLDEIIVNFPEVIVCQTFSPTTHQVEHVHIFYKIS